LELGVLLFDGVEEGEAIVCDQVHGGDEGFEAFGVAVALEVHGEAGEPRLGQEDGSRLEGPGDVVAVAVDHEDDGAWGGRGVWEPGPCEEREATRRPELGFCGSDSLLLVVFFFWGEAPIVWVRLHKFFLFFFHCSHTMMSKICGFIGVSAFAVLSHHILH